MSDEPTRPPSPPKNNYQSLVEASSLGFMFPLAIGIGYAWGWGIDKLFGTKPWFAAIFTAFGVIAAFVNLFRLAGKDKSDPPAESKP